MPSRYVENQRNYNNFYKDGRKLAFAEETNGVASFFSGIIDSTNADKSSFLDVGCRMGYTINFFQERYPDARVVGVDIVPEFVDEASNFGEAMIADAHELPFKDEEFDWVFCAQTLEHCYNPQKAANELVRVTKHGLMIGLPLEGRGAFTHNFSHYAYTDNPITWLRLFEKHNKFRLFSAIGGNQSRYMNFTFLRVEYEDV